MPEKKWSVCVHLCLVADTTDDLVLDATLVATTKHAEEALLTPVLVPAVGKKPVLAAVVNTIAQQLNGVVTKQATTDVMIDTRSVHHEIFINSKAGLARTASRKLSNDVVVAAHIVDIRSRVLVSLPSLAILALTSAGRSGIVLRGARVLAAGDVVVARRERIGTAVLSNNTILLPVEESIRGLATVAATATRASKDILRAQNNIGILSDASTIAHSSSRANSPAGTAGRLVAHHLHRRAVGIVITGIIGVRSIGNLLSSASTTPHEVGRMLEALRTSTDKRANLIIRKTSNRRSKRSLPKVGLCIDFTNKLHSIRTRSAGCNSNNSSNNNKSLNKLHSD